jgi:transcription antitermination factor NusA-like protein
VRVPEDQLSLAIGKQGQNVRLAAKLTGWNIDIISCRRISRGSYRRRSRRGSSSRRRCCAAPVW